MSHSHDLQWEYETFRPPREATKKEVTDPKTQLNALGSEGWELAETVEYTGGGTKFLVFKRPAGANEESE